MNERGCRIGEGHPRAVLSDHEVDLLHQLLDERAELLKQCRAVKMSAADIHRSIIKARLSYGLLAQAFEVSKSTVYDIAVFRIRGQVAAGWKRAK